MENTVTIKRRQYGAQQELKHVSKAEVSDYRKKGWVLYHDPIQEPAKPDLEVMELRLKDAKEELAKAEQTAAKIVGLAKSKVSNLDVELMNAKNAIQTEVIVLAEAQRIRDVDDVKERVVKILSPNKPVPERVLRGLGINQNQSQFLNSFLDNSRYVGKDSEGDRLFVLDKVAYLQQEASRKEVEAKAKEQEIRARMEAK